MAKENKKTAGGGGAPKGSDKARKEAKPATVAVNREARHNYFIEDKYEAGLVLNGWEIKAVRAGRAHLKQSWVDWRNGAFWLVGCHISALPEASTHVNPVALRERKLLLNQREIDKLRGQVERAGYTVIPLDLHFSGSGRLKVEIGLAKGKKMHDKRESSKEADWKREKARLMRHSA